MASKLPDRIVLPERVWALRHAACRDETRGIICGVHVTKDYAEATDGHIAVRVAFDETDHEDAYERHGVVPDDIVIRVHTRNDPEPAPATGDNDGFIVLDRIAETDHYADCERSVIAEVIHGNFVPVENVIPEEDGLVSIALNADLIVRAAEAFGMQSNTVRILVDINGIEDGHLKRSPIVLRSLTRPSAGFGLVMPMKGWED